MIWSGSKELQAQRAVTDYGFVSITFAHLVDRFKLWLFNVVDVEFPQRSAPSSHLGSTRL
jgi:hypothetical protein